MTISLPTKEMITFDLVASSFVKLIENIEKHLGVSKLKAIFENACLLGIMFRSRIRSRHPVVFLRKGVRKISSKFTGEQPWRSVILKLHFGMGVLL